MTAARDTQLYLFRQRLPRKPYATYDLKDGIHVRSVEFALRARYIQANGPTHRYWLIFDIDRAGATLDWYDRDCPAPSIVATNPENGHAHLFYGLDIPVRTAPDASQKALRYAAAIEHALMLKLGADASYCGLICKNPLHDYWQVACFEPEPYTLDWLADYVDLSAYSSKKPLPDYGLGRNCTLFESTRKWSYKAIRQGWPDYERWLEAVTVRAHAYNHKFDTPLPLKEVDHVAKSIARWTHRHMSAATFAGYVERTHTSSVQALRGKRSGVTRRKGSITEAKPWEALGISRATWYRRNKTE